MSREKLRSPGRFLHLSLPKSIATGLISVAAILLALAARSRPKPRRMDRMIIVVLVLGYLLR